MANELESFKFGKLIATVRRIGHTKLFRVEIVGAGDEVTTHLYSSSAENAAVDIIDELHFANENPDAFYIRRRSWIRKLDQDPIERKKEWGHVHELFEYAQRNRIPLWQAVTAIQNSESRRVI